MQLPLFFYEGTLEPQKDVPLDEVTTKHILQVLRMKQGESLMLTDGNGRSALVNIVEAEKKKGIFRVATVNTYPPRSVRMHLAVAFTKNAGRNEWLLEKAVELGVASILPISSDRSEKDHFRYDRWRNILVSALIQSRQYHLPVLKEVQSLESVIDAYATLPQKLVCHCIERYSKAPLAQAMKAGAETIVLIGPEGDFTEKEVELAANSGYRGINLGTQRLRTETAAMTVSAYFNLVNYDA